MINKDTLSMKKKVTILLLSIFAIGCIVFTERYISQRNMIKNKKEEIITLRKEMPYLHYSMDAANLTLDQKVFFLKSVNKFINRKEKPYSIENYENYPKPGKVVTSKILVTWSQGGLQEVYNVTTSDSKGTVKLYKALWEIQADARNDDKMNTSDESITQKDYDRNKELLEGAPDDD